MDTEKHGLNPEEWLQVNGPMYEDMEQDVRDAVSGLIHYAAALAATGREERLPLLREQVGFMASYWLSGNKEGSEQRVLADFDREVASAQKSGHCAPMKIDEKAAILRGVRTHTAELRADLGADPICQGAELLLAELEQQLEPLVQTEGQRLGTGQEQTLG